MGEEIRKRSSSNLLVRECMVEAVLKLTAEKPLGSVSVSELCRVAGVSRMSFYRNYSSKEAVFEEHLKDIMKEYLDEEMEMGEGVYCDFAHLVHCFSYFYEYREFLDGMFRCELGDIFLEMLTEYIQKNWKAGNRKEQYTMSAFAGVLYGTYMEWSAQGYAESAEEMAGLLSGHFLP